MDITGTTQQPATPGSPIHHIVGQLIAISGRLDGAGMEIGGIALALGLIADDVDAKIERLHAGHRADLVTASSRAIREAAGYIQDFRSEYTAAEALEEYAAEHYPTTAKPLDHFKVTYQAPTANSVQVVADEIRCLDCQSTTGLAGVFEPTLDQLTDMASRHQCLPRIPKES